MKILYKDYKKNKVKLKVESLDDLWTLTYIIEEGDVIRSRTARKIKLGEGKERQSKVVKRYVFLGIKVEKTEFHEYSNMLRVNGKIIQGTDEIPTGNYHTINIEIDSVFELEKEIFLRYQIKKIKEAAQSKDAKIMICIHDREEALFALLKKYGYEILTRLKGDVTKKAEVNMRTSNFYSHIKKVITEYDKRYNFDSIVIASPSFWKEYLLNQIKDDSLKKKIVTASCSTVNENGINEVIKRPEVKQVLKKQRFSNEINKIENLIKEISINGKSVYGIDHVRSAVYAGAVSELLVTDKFIREKRLNNEFKETEDLMRKTEKMDGQVHIITSEHEGGKKLDGLGGIAGLLRYKIAF
ncbi:mRNA surveillance protein pelota [Candidatus Woesearchaeota archaeon]|nr:mRNA surveillance protein pelota [Candidatus Woesearchaeota archaeon]